MSDRKTLYLVDGSNIAFRAFFAIRSLSNSKGEPTNALYGVTSMVFKLLREHQPDYLAFVFDPPGGSFRQEMFPEYKGHRPDTPAEFKVQIPQIRELIESLGLAYVVETGFEADDVVTPTKPITLVERFDSDVVPSIISDEVLHVRVSALNVRSYNGVQSGISKILYTLPRFSDGKSSKPSTVTSITTSIHLPDGTLAKTDGSSAVIYKIVKMNNAPLSILNDFVKPGKKGEKKK